MNLNLDPAAKQRILGQLGTLRGRLEKLEKTWGIKKAAGNIGEPFNSPGVYAHNEAPLAEVLAAAVAAGKEAAKNRILQSETFRTMVRNAVKQAENNKNMLDANAGIVVAVLQEALAEAEQDEAESGKKHVGPLTGNSATDRDAYESAMAKSAQIESFKKNLASPAPGHETNFFAQREHRKTARELLHRTRQIAAGL